MAKRKTVTALKKTAKKTAKTVQKSVKKVAAKASKKVAKKVAVVKTKAKVSKVVYDGDEPSNWRN